MPAGRPKREDGRNSETVAHIKYQKEAYDKITIAFEKTTKEKLTIAAALAGQSLAQYVAEACDRRIEQDSENNPKLIAAMVQYYAEVLDPTREARDKRTGLRWWSPERIRRRELDVCLDAESKPESIKWVNVDTREEDYARCQRVRAVYHEIKKAPEELLVCLPSSGQ